MNSCPYYLLTDVAIGKLTDLKGKALACRVGPASNAPLAETFQELAQLQLGQDLALQLLNSDEDAFNALLEGKVQAALLPRPYGFIAEERGFKRIGDWPDVVDEPLPITLETTDKLQRERDKDFSTFLEAHREGIIHLKANRVDAVRMLTRVFGHSPAVSSKTFDDYIGLMDERLTVEFKQLEKLLSQIAPDTPGGAKKVASEWIVPGGLRA
jgi:ABC-type amino acid transport substrate-binding protein